MLSVIPSVFVAIDKKMQQQETCLSYLQQHFAAVDAHGIHGAKGHESNGDRRRCVHRIIVTEQT